MKRRILIFLVFIIVLAAAAVLVFNSRNLRKTMASVSEETTACADDSIVYVYYADTYLCLDKNGIVCANNSQKPEDIPEAVGVQFLRMAFGKKAEAEEKTALDYVLKVAADLSKQEIRADRIEYQNRQITVYMDELEIRLGKNEKTDDKISDLADFIDKLEGKSGVLYMQNGNANNYGYTFRAN